MPPPLITARVPGAPLSPEGSRDIPFLGIGTAPARSPSAVERTRLPGVPMSFFPVPRLSLPDRATHHTRILYQKRGDVSKALELFEEGRRGGCTAAATILGLLYEERGDVSKAMKLYEEALGRPTQTLEGGGARPGGPAGKYCPPMSAGVRVSTVMGQFSHLFLQLSFHIFISRVTGQLPYLLITTDVSTDIGPATTRLSRPSDPIFMECIFSGFFPRRLQLNGIS